MTLKMAHKSVKLAIANALDIGENSVVLNVSGSSLDE